MASTRLFARQAAEQGLALLLGKTQGLPVQQAGAAAGLQTGERGWWRLAAYQDPGDSRRGFAHPLGQDRVQGVFGLEVLVVVQDQQGPGWQRGEQRAQVLAGECRQAVAELGQQRRQLEAAFELASRQPEIVEKRGRLAIVGIEVQPRGRPAALFGVNGRQVGLARPGGADDPGERPLETGRQRSMRTLTQQRSRNLGSENFGNTHCPWQISGQPRRRPRRTSAAPFWSNAKDQDTFCQKRQYEQGRVVQVI